MWEPTADERAGDAAMLDAAIAAAKPKAFRPVAPAQWRVGAAPRPDPPPRWASELAGGAVRECDAGSAEGLAAAAAAVRRRLPIVLRGAAAALLPGHERLASEAALAEALATVPLTVLHAPRDAGRRFSYYFTEHAARHEPPPPPLNMKLKLSWDEFVRRLRAPPTEGAVYAQVDLATREGTALRALAKDRADMRAGVSDDLLELLSAAVHAPPMSDLVKPLGAWTLSKLYVGPADTLAPCHWDGLDNFFVQLQGRKSILLFPPDTKGLRPFPADHPYDSRAQANIERPDAAAAAELRGCGGVALLEAGDLLFIPHHWYHHIHSDAANARPSISLNFWFNPFAELLDGGVRDGHHMHAHLARAAEIARADARRRRRRLRRVRRRARRRRRRRRWTSRGRAQLRRQGARRRLRPPRRPRVCGALRPAEAGGCRRSRRAARC